MSQNDLEYSLGMNLGPLAQAGMAISKWGDETTKVLNRKFAAAELFKGIAQGLGIASVQQIADKLVAPFKESAESAKRIAEYSEQAATSQQNILDRRKTDLEKLAAIEGQMKRIRDGMDAPVEVSWWRRKASAIAGALGMDGLSDSISGRDEEQERKHRAAAELAKLADEADKKRIELEEKKFDQEIHNQLVRAEYVRQNREQLELEAKLLSGRILPDERARLEVLQLQSKERDLDARMQAILEKYPAERTEAEKQTLIQLTNQRSLLEKQIDQKRQLIAATKQQADKEAQVYALAVKQLEAMQQMDQLKGKASLVAQDTLYVNGKAYGPSRDPAAIAAASSDALQELIRRNQLEIDSVKASEGHGPTALADAATGYLIQGSVIARLQTDIQRAQYQLDLRNQAGSGSLDSRQAFGGDPLAYDNYVRSNTEAVTLQTQLLTEIRDGQRKGIPVIPLTPITPPKS